MFSEIFDRLVGIAPVDPDTDGADGAIAVAPVSSASASVFVNRNFSFVVGVGVDWGVE